MKNSNEFTVDSCRIKLYVIDNIVNLKSRAKSTRLMGKLMQDHPTAYSDDKPLLTPIL